MSVSLIVDNTKLKAQILSGEKHMANFTKEESAGFVQLIASMPLNEQLAFTSKAATAVQSVFGYDELHPDWLVDGTEFEHDIWKIQVGTNKLLTIDFNVPLNDKKSLVSIKHRPLLNAFKHWLVQAGNPLLNGGRLLKSNTTYRQIRYRLTLIDAILLRAADINLAERHMLAVDSDFVQDLLVQYVEGGTSRLYRYHKIVREYLLEKIETVSDTAAKAFAEQFPYVTRPIYDDENELLLTEGQIVKACCFLYGEGAYLVSRQVSPKVNARYFLDIFFKEQTLYGESSKPFSIKTLAIKPDENSTEYRPVPVSDNKNSGVGEAALSPLLTDFRGLAAIDAVGTSLCPDKTFDNIEVKTINELVIVRSTGRFTTLPADVVFSAMRNAFEFCIEYADVILDSMYQVLKHVPSENKRNKTVTGGYTYSVADYKGKEFLEHVSPELIELGVCQWCIKPNAPDRFELRRQNRGFVDLYHVLMGAIQVITGATMARRAGELIDLHPTDCLLPSGVDPNLESSEKVEFELIFDNRKSGVGGDKALRETLSRPILRGVASLLYKLEAFNEKLIEDKLITQKNSTLFPFVDQKNITLKPIKAASYNVHLDAFCDYIESPTVQYAEDDERRYYIRQHQLRRFFAMVFFWRNGTNSLDTLRHFLGHTDSEHLYHYVTEGLQGEVLAGIKARCIREGMSKHGIENIDKLAPILKERYGVDYLKLKGYREVLSDYEDCDEDDAHLSPPLELIREQFEKDSIDFEKDITKLLLDGTIDLEPEFFTVKDEAGNTITDYKMILRVKEEF
ncbi:hypothetical protein [Photobacterium chitinilyticum]|uniref:Integrase n=1 Tax=Photobacterium chitinilyticum TaxID=2485123 RepID=A0A444JQU9_9GAMM|nr:hypothetical protein [Photobacterium chitinilyticum]RWX55348.1 hypothetical protein EDI28_12345 [Photobacterium chitinilyticum]